MKYITKVVGYSPKADTMAEKIEEIANDMAKDDYELVTITCTESAKAILVFKNMNE